MKILTKPETNSFLGEIEYQYIETGYEEKDYAEVYDFAKRTIPVCISFPDEHGCNNLKFQFITPDRLFDEVVIISLDDFDSYNGKELIFKVILNDFNQSNGTIEFKGNFIFEFKKQDGFHVFNIRLIFEDNKLFNSLIKSSYLINK